ncbi:Vesicle transport protein S20 [Coemansia guatemalensis]|uniref:Vesicle transport protein S20 n=1 Tax=Coemansia guatemalensis TaxID=2761395 RepID=A0A9W8I0C5_9FUNG|nr:Vesicle transport protein S20 [Coemansia guatemalensis]
MSATEESNPLDSCLRELATELDELEADIVLLGKFSGPRDEQRRLSDSIREQQRTAERLIERLRLAAEDYGAEQQQTAIQERVHEQEQRAKQQQRSFRSALLKYQGNVAAAAKKERELLLSGAATPAELRRRKARTGNAALNAASDVTTALQETVSMMNEEIDKSVSNIMAMEDSSEKLRKTKAQYIAMDDILKMSRNLIRTLEQADVVDRWLMLAGLVLFSFVAFNILRKRVWIPGLYTLFRMVRYLFTLGIETAGSADAVSSPRLASELLTDNLVAMSAAVTATTMATATLSASVLDTLDDATMTPSPATLAGDSSLLPSISTQDTFATTTGVGNSRRGTNAHLDNRAQGRPYEDSAPPQKQVPPNEPALPIQQRSDQQHSNQQQQQPNQQNQQAPQAGDDHQPREHLNLGQLLPGASGKRRMYKPPVEPVRRDEL